MLADVEFANKNKIFSYPAVCEPNCLLTKVFVNQDTWVCQLQVTARCHTRVGCQWRLFVCPYPHPKPGALLCLDLVCLGSFSQPFRFTASSSGIIAEVRSLKSSGLIPSGFSIMRLSSLFSCFSFYSSLLGPQFFWRIYKQCYIIFRIPPASSCSCLPTAWPTNISKVLFGFRISM